MALAASVISCNRDQVKPVALPANTPANQELATVAQALARTLGDAATYRQLLKAEALKQFDGDYDVLYRAFAAQQPGFGQRMDELVAGKGSQPLAGMADVLAHVPNLNISVPVHIDKWDAGSLAPLVLFIPADYDEKTYTKPLQAYDKNGQVHLLDAKKAPDYPVVVVGPSERVKGSALTSESFGPGSNKHKGGSTTNMVPADDPNNPSPPYYPYPPDPTPPTGQPYTTCRTDKQNEYLTSLWMEDVSEYEAWVLGQPEIHLIIMSPIGGASGTTLLDVMYTMSRGGIEDTWYCNTSLYYWDKSTISNSVGYLWYEQDEGDSSVDVKFTIGYKDDKGVNGSTEVTFKIKNKDDIISTSPMNFDFCPSEKYYTGGTTGSRAFRWTLENRP